MTQTQAHSDSSPKWTERCLTAIAAGALAFACFGAGLSYGLTDLDTMMNIAAARVDTLRDLESVLLGKLTGGRAGINANFYRPTLMALVAAIRGLFGWEPAAYHAVNIILHGICTALVVAFARKSAMRFGYRRPRSLSLFAGLVFALHPITLEVVPAIARAGDLLVTTFLIASMLAVDRYIEACQIESRSMSVAGLKRASIFCIMAALALTSKEPAVVLFAAAPLYLLLARRDAPMIRRTQELAVLMVPALCVGLIYFLVRARVLGESFGGYHLDNTIWDMALLVANFLPGDLLAPGFPSAVESVLPFYAKLSLFFSSTLGYAFAGITLIAFGSWGLWLWASRTSTRTNLESDRDADRTAVMRTLVFGLSVMGVFAIVFALTAAYDRRLLYPMLPFYSLLPALLFDAAYHEAGLTVRGRASSVSIVRRSALIGIGAIALVALLVQSPLLSRDQEWREAGRATDLLTTGLQEQWDELPSRSLVWVVNLPAGFDFDSSRRIQYTERSSTNALNAAALQSWLDDRWPRRKLRVNSLGSYRYHEPLWGFRHNARLHEGWLEFDEPRARADVDYVFARERGFELRELGEGRLALARSKAPRPRHEYLLVADGIAPIFVSTSKLEVIH